MRNRLYYLIFSEFFQVFAPIFLSLIFLGAAYRLSSIGDIEQVYLSFKNTLLVFLYLIPVTVPIILPLSFLFSLTLFIIKFRINNEFLALFISNVTPRRIFYSISIFAIPLFIAALTNSLFLKPYCTLKLQQLITTNSFEQIKSIKHKSIKRLTESTFLYAETNKDNILSNVLYYKGSRESSRLTVISAKEMFIHNPKSLFQVTFTNGTLFNVKAYDATVSQFGSFAVNPFKQREIENISPRIISSQSLFFITKLDKFAFREAVELCERFYLPFAVIIFSLYIFSFAVSSKNGNYLSTILISLSIGILYFALFFLLYSLGKNGVLKPFVYFPLTLFFLLIAGIISFRYKLSRIF